MWVKKKKMSCQYSYLDTGHGCSIKWLLGAATKVGMVQSGMSTTIHRKKAKNYCQIFMLLQVDWCKQVILILATFAAFQYHQIVAALCTREN